jgi:carbonyl reductase 1
MKRRIRQGFLLSLSLLLLLLAVGSLGMAPSLPAKSPTTRVALITGANKGIGKEIVRQLAQLEEGGDDDDSSSWIILLGSRDQDVGDKAVQELVAETKTKTHSNTRIICCPLDVTDDQSIQEAKTMVEKHGQGKLHVLINNAAICFNDPTLYGRVPYTPFEQQANITVTTNFFGTLKVTQTMVPLLLASESPRIINIASAAGRLAILRSQSLVQTFTSPSLQLQELEALMQQFVSDVEAGIHTTKGWPNTCYGMSKLGIIAMTKVMARHYPGIMINSVDPGYCATEQNNNQGVLPASRGAVTPCYLAKKNLPANHFNTGKHFFQEQEIAW